MSWNNPDHALPLMAERVLVETEEGSVLFAKRVQAPLLAQGWHWIDDQSLPLRSPVVRWRYIVAGSET